MTYPDAGNQCRGIRGIVFLTYVGSSTTCDAGSGADLGATDDSGIVDSMGAGAFRRSTLADVLMRTHSGAMSGDGLAKGGGCSHDPLSCDNWTCSGVNYGSGCERGLQRRCFLATVSDKAQSTQPWRGSLQLTRPRRLVFASHTGLDSAWLILRISHAALNRAYARATAP
jgi:hypothetical protein